MKKTYENVKFRPEAEDQTIKYLEKYHPGEIKVEPFDAAKIDDIIDEITNLEEVTETMSIYDCINGTILDTKYHEYELRGTYEDIIEARKKIMNKAGIEVIYDDYEKANDMSVSVEIENFMRPNFISKDMAIDLAEKEKELSFVSAFSDIIIIGTESQNIYVVVTRDGAFVEELTLYIREATDFNDFRF